MRKSDIKIGMRVRVLRHDNKDYCFPDTTKKEMVGKILKVNKVNIEHHEEYVSLVNGFDCLFYFHPDNLSCEDSLESLVAGDILVGEGGPYRRVLARLGGEGELTTYALSCSSTYIKSDNLKSGGDMTTAFELNKFGYKLYQPEEEVETSAEQEAMALLKKNGYEIIKK